MIDEPHNIKVYGVWHNDSSAGVEVWCHDCKRALLYSEDEGYLTLAQITEAVTGHS